MKHVLLFLGSVLAFVFFATGCTTMSPEKCQQTNWYELGKSDGVNGRSQKKFDKYQRACSEVGVPADQLKYEAGRGDGLRVYCTYENGHQIGLRGQSYNGVCPRDIEPEFMRGYSVGQSEFAVQQREDDLRRRETVLQERETAQAVQAQALASAQAMASTGRRSCNFDSDCAIQSHCDFSRCASTGAKCTFDSDCSIAGQCAFQTTCTDGNCYNGRVCKY